MEKESTVSADVPQPQHEVVVRTKKEGESEHEPSLMHNLNVLALAASPEIRQMEEGRIKSAASAPNSNASSVEGDQPLARIGCVRKQFQAALESATPESQLMLHDYEMSTSHVNSSSKQRSKPVRSVKTRNRKTKSLAVISRRFLERLPLYPSVGDPVVLSLNHLPTELGVERRRIYDILNILESVEMVRRLGRNQYQYLGYSRLPNALAELRHQGNCEGLRELIEAAERERRDELAEKRERRRREAEALLAAEKKRQIAAKATAASRSSLSTAIELLASAAGKVECNESGVEDEDDESSSSSESSSAPSSPIPAAENTSVQVESKPTITTVPSVSGVRNLSSHAGSGFLVADHNSMVTGSDDAASLGVICRRFLMLLLVSEPPVVTLNTAARVVGCQSAVACHPRPAVPEKENSGPSSANSRCNSSTIFKSKLRRLYDVTNVLATVGLVKREVDGVPVDKEDKDEKDEKDDKTDKADPNTSSSSSSSSSPSTKDSKDPTKPEKIEPGETSLSAAAAASGTTAERKLRGPVFRYTGPPISSLPPVSASRLSELPSSTIGNHRHGSHAKSTKCQLQLIRNGSAVCLPTGTGGAGTSSSSLVIVPGNSKPLRIMTPGSHSASTSGTVTDDPTQRQLVAPLGIARTRTFTSGISQSPAAVIMPSTPLLAPPRLASLVPTASSESAGCRVRPNSLLGKLLGSQNPSATTTNSGAVSCDQALDATKRTKPPTIKRSGDGDGTSYAPKQSRLVHSSQGNAEGWNAQERIVVIAPSSSCSGIGGTVDSRTAVPLIVSHAQLSMQKSQHMQKQPQQPTAEADDEVVVVVHDQPSSGAKVTVNDKNSPVSSDGEFLSSVHHSSVPVKDVVDWLC